MDRHQRWPSKGKPHIYKQSSGKKQWTVRVYDPVSKRVQAYRTKYFAIACIYAKSAVEDNPKKEYP